MADVQPYPPLYTLHTTRCGLGWSIFMAYCKAWQASSLAHRELSPDDPALDDLDGAVSQALDAHRLHQENCRQCRTRLTELNELAKGAS
jgi:hypothetical protein